MIAEGTGHAHHTESKADPTLCKGPARMRTDGGSCVLRAACHVEARQQGLPRKASLIVCPPTLVGHWPHEIAKFVGPDLLSVLQAGSLPPRTLLCSPYRTPPCSTHVAPTRPLPPPCKKVSCSSAGTPHRPVTPAWLPALGVMD